MSIERICQRNVDTIGPSDSAYQAAERMHQRTVGALVVVDKDQTPIGIVTDRDLMVRVIAGNCDPHTTLVRDVMTPRVRVAPPGMPVETALSTMRVGAFRRLPIVDEQGRLAGLVALDDILMLLATEFNRAGGVLERETPQAAALSASR